MEWIVPVLLAFLVFSAAAQVLWAYSLGVIAKKGGQSELMQVLAWIPILQLAPMIVAGGGSIQAFLLGSIGLVIGAVVLGMASAFVGGTVGSAIGLLCLLFTLILIFGYCGRLFWTMAVERDLSGWVGLLLFVPVVNFFIFPYIALHDGWSSPNAIGLVIGLVLTIGSTAPSFQTVRLLNQEGGLPPELAALLAGNASELMEMKVLGDLSSDAAMPTAMPLDTNSDGAEIDPTEAIRVLFSMQDRFERLRLLVESPQIERPEQRQIAIDLLRSIDAELKAHRGVLDGKTYQELALGLVETEARIEAAAGPDHNGGLSLSTSAAARQKTRRSSGPGPASIGFAQGHAPAPIRPIPVQAADGCPGGTEMRTRARGDGEEEWCQQIESNGGLRHGWYAHYLSGGEPESMGEYANGLRVGVWTRFYPSGNVRAQAQFVKGMQHGWLLSFDEGGQRTQAVRFDKGVVVPTSAIP